MKLYYIESLDEIMGTGYVEYVRTLEGDYCTGVYCDDLQDAAFFTTREAAEDELDLENKEVVVEYDITGKVIVPISAGSTSKLISVVDDSGDVCVLHIIK